MKAYPLEWAEAMWGFVEGSTVYICVMERVGVDATTDEEIEYEVDAELGEQRGDFILLGDIHSHTGEDAACALSELDIEEATRTATPVTGICCIRKFPKRRQVSFGFFHADGKPIEWTVAEDNK